jgi:hypothetical protein
LKQNDREQNVDKWNYKRTGGSRREKVGNCKHILTILNPAILPVY